MKFSELAKELEPYFIDLINKVMGDQKSVASNTKDLTYIHGTGFPTDDNTHNRGAVAVDLQLYRDSDSDTAQGIGTSILGGYANQTDDQVIHSAILGGKQNRIGNGSSSGSYSAALGEDALVDNDFSMAIGAGSGVQGGSQVGFFSGNSSETVTSAWNDIYSWYIRTDTTWVFRALVCGIRQGAAESFGYEVTGVIENDGGTTTLLASTVTTLYEDDASYDVQAVADDGNDQLAIQIQDTDNAGNASRWHITLITSEQSWAA